MEVQGESRKELLVRLVPEIGQSLGAVRSATQALLNGADEDRSFRRELLEGIEGEMSHLQRQLENLVQYQALSSGAFKLDYRRVLALEWLKRTLDKWRQIAEDKRIIWEEETAGNVSYMFIDPSRMSLVVDNLLCNAIDNTPAGGEVIVNSMVDGDIFQVEIIDTGPGVPRLVAERLAGRQVKKRSDSLSRGLGLGLIIAQEMVSAHGGRMILDREIKVGSRIIIRVPITPAH
jgi:signal transduction histidine kinase